MDYNAAMDRCYTRPSRACEHKATPSTKPNNKRTDLLKDGDLVQVVDLDSKFFGRRFRVRVLRNSANVDLMENGVRIETLEEGGVRRVREEAC